MICKCSSHNGFLTAKGLAEAAQRERQLDGVDNMELFPYLDKVGSVSGSSLVAIHWDDALVDQQHQRFLNGW